jgi:23S rRNA (pseudouridine1915-N3)-methyltransferase
VKIRIVAIGKDRKGRFEPAIQDYATRIAALQPFELVVAGEAQGDDEAARRAEAKLLRGKLRPRDLVVALDERGEQLTSEGLAGRIQRVERSGGRDLAFVIGGPSGLEPALRSEEAGFAGRRAEADGGGRSIGSEAAWTLALSKLTLPHQLARLVLVEQLYRALTILRGLPYHK